ncbi:hypothetical protein K438DRAFT_2024931 [Mycena galopus ATCC 62051]|nr:hypothetical protein K438DRAFT_2024931 [Mycena galopus ATCC 62051]
MQNLQVALFLPRPPSSLRFMMIPSTYIDDIQVTAPIALGSLRICLPYPVSESVVQTSIASSLSTALTFQPLLGPMDYPSKRRPLCRVSARQHRPLYVTCLPYQPVLVTSFSLLFRSSGPQTIEEASLIHFIIACMLSLVAYILNRSSVRWRSITTRRS